MANLGALATVPRHLYEGQAFRQQGPAYDALSGEGARQFGGRYNPPSSFPVLYLCTTRACAVAELRRQGERQAIGLAGLLPRVLYRYELSLSVVDLTSAAVAAALDVTGAELIQPELRLTQQLGEVAHHLGIVSLLTLSATGVDRVLVVFLENLGLGALAFERVEQWNTVEDLVP
ncbi:MAG: RES family NAD+ phosphorylase [Acidimicrobiales bacterium]